MRRVVHVPYTVEQDETGWFCAHAALPGGGANGEGRVRGGARQRQPPIMKHADGRRTTVPVHQGRDIRPGTLRAILRDIGLGPEDLKELL
jgi:hypothetical protein